MDDILAIANRLRDIVAQVAFGEFYWQDAHYNHDSRLGRELLYLIANDEWIRSTTEIIDISRADAVRASNGTSFASWPPPRRGFSWPR
jgi:hypothetical protein